MEQTTDHLEQAVLDEARKVNEERMKAVKHLAAIVAEKHDLEEQVKDNARRERQAIKAAEKAGWTQAQIKRFMKPPKKQSASSQAGDRSMGESPQQQPHQSTTNTVQV